MYMIIFQVMFWISDKETFVTAEEFGHDLEHVEVGRRFVISRDGPDTLSSRIPNNLSTGWPDMENTNIYFWVFYV